MKEDRLWVSREFQRSEERYVNPFPAFQMGGINGLEQKTMEGEGKLGSLCKISIGP